MTYAGGGSSPDTLLHVFQNPGGRRLEIDWDDDCLPTTVGGACEYAEVGITNRMHNKNLPDNTLRIKSSSGATSPKVRVTRSRFVALAVGSPTRRS